MKINKILQISGTMLTKEQLQRHLEELASEQNITNKSKKETYPVPHLIENFNLIREVYDILNEHLKLGITIHPAGEWILDNLYVIEETVKIIQRELTLKKYMNFPGIANGNYEGFARVFVLASEIIAYTDSNIKKENLEDYLRSYQNKKTLSMDEIWSIGIFLQIAIIENIAKICRAIYSSQMQKLKAESIVERLIENKDRHERKFGKILFKVGNNTRYSFIEYMSYILKRYGRKGYTFLNVLKETVEMSGTTISDVIKKEHYDIALKKVLVGNGITSIKEIQRLNFLDIFEKINGVEELLKKDPAGVYEHMDYKTKEYYRMKIKEIATSTNISEIYIAKKIISLADEKDADTKQSHIGYYIIDEGINDLYNLLGYKNNKKMKVKDKVKLYIFGIFGIATVLSLIMAFALEIQHLSWPMLLVSFIVFFIPSTEVATQIIQWILSKIVKPKIIPKLDMQNGIPKAYSTMVVVPTIIDNEKKTKELIHNLEVFYLANKSKNIYFTLLGDCSQSNKQELPEDDDIINIGIEETKKLNEKYKTNKDEPDIFNFIYRKRVWNKKQNKFLGWERKRGMLTQFNEFLLGKPQEDFRVNTFDNSVIPKIKYVITLDADTELILNSAFQLVGAMAHILNTPVIDEKTDTVVEGYGLIQPRVGVDLEISNKNLFTKIFAGAGGIDLYTNAISDIYQDNFGEGIFTGKGIYDLEVFEKVLRNKIPENTVLSHDLLEGSYVRTGLATDIMLMDGYPEKYLSFMNRLSRWIRGDWQIIRWLGFKSPLNTLSKFKIFDNLRRSLFEISIILGYFYLNAISILYNKNTLINSIYLTLIVILPFILEILNTIIFKKQGEQKQKTFTPRVDGIKGALARAAITFGCLSYKSYVSLKAILKTLYRMLISHKNLLEWQTAEESERQTQTDMFSYTKQMSINIVFGLIAIVLGIYKISFGKVLVGLIWISTPAFMCYISRPRKDAKPIEKVSKEEIEYVLEIGKRTWRYFEKYLNQENNYLIPDNYQEDRKEVIIPRTSSTNIGLSILAVIAACDLKYITLDKCLDLLKNIITTIIELPKWNGHLYNWYQIQKKEPLIPRYVSTVDSGNFVGYLYVLKSFLAEVNETQLLSTVENLINDTDFSKLYHKDHQIFSIGFNIEENKLTNSYYDLLASEARQASLIAIAKNDVPEKHWGNLSRTLTTVGKYKGLISWSGTAFEYLMPNINMKNYVGSLLDESCKFMIMSQMEYARKLNIPWGISEAAFNVKDLHGNYQYKAFGIPWLGLKRGLADEMVVSSYGSILALNEKPKEVIKNIKDLAKQGMYSEFGFYESIDYTPQRVEKGQRASVVKTYMAHHQGLILLSINNFINNNIFQKRFSKNPEIEAVNILLQERLPEKVIITKENKEKVEKPKYVDYEGYTESTYRKIDTRITCGNIISNEEYSVAMNQKGLGFSKYKDIYINRFKQTKPYKQGIQIYIKNIKTKSIWSMQYKKGEESQYKVSFMPDKNEIEKVNGSIKSKLENCVVPNEPVEIRRISLENTNSEDEIVEVTTFFEPVLSKADQDYAHPAYNNLFLNFDFDSENQSLEVNRKNVWMNISLNTESEAVGELEYEIDREKFLGRGNLGIPKMILNSIPLSKQVGLVTDPIVALKKTIKIPANSKAKIDLVISVGEDKENVRENLLKYKSKENVKLAFDLSKARVKEESRYLGIKGKEIEQYQKLMSYIVFGNPTKSVNIKQKPKETFKKSELWKYGISGDYPILLVKIKDVNDNYVAKQVLKAYEYMRVKNIETELVILDEEKHSYENYVREEIEEEILDNNMGYMKNIKGGIFYISKAQVSKQDIDLIEFLATIIIDSSKGGIASNLREDEERYIEQYKSISDDAIPQTIVSREENDIDILKDKEKLKYFNEYGGFSENGKEYLIKTSKSNRLPTVWSHVIANDKFGTVVTENMGGYTWYKNCRLNRISTWQNDATMDTPSEIIYIKDEESKLTWSLGQNPKPDDNNYNVIYGFGYAKYIHKNLGIEQTYEVFVPKKDSVKIGILTLKNTTLYKKKLKIIHFIDLTMGEEELKTRGNLVVQQDKNNNIIYCKKLVQEDENNNIVYSSSSEKIKSFTGDKKTFLGESGLQNPECLRKISLDNDSGLGKDACLAFEIEVEIDSFSQKEISIILGAEETVIDSKNIAYKYRKVEKCKEELKEVIQHWDNLLQKVQVETPLESVNLMLNGWAIYQTVCSRLLARSGFYQSGGAFGFRDQLQDALSLKYFDPRMLENQIYKHAAHQFEEGDVEHWWHEEGSRGIRTKFSDDLLWLPYSVCEYIEFTGNNQILEKQVNYLKGDVLKDNEDERYNVYLSSEKEGSIYEHCIKAIERSLNFGKNGLPKIGTGDWNDGLNKVGNKGEGESIWLGFFIYDILEKFIPICEQKGDIKLVEKYRQVQQELKKALNTNGWDGRWYRRAYMDNGDVLGSLENDECKIDSIAQSWSVISNAGDNDKKYISLESLENHLIDRENGIIKLLDPPFEKSKLEPGYIKAYLPGVRENGGQYTHSAIWLVIAESMLGFGDKALELYRMINPIEHARTKEVAQKYKVEPYVIAADIYGSKNLAGRGGWTWYTGSSSWYYKAGIQYILGLTVEKGIIKFSPCIPKDWKEYKIKFKWGKSIYNIKVENPNGKNGEIEKIYLNGKPTENSIKLEDDGKVHNIKIIL